MRGLMRSSAMVGLASLLFGCMAGHTSTDVFTKSYIVQLTAAPLVSYAGGIVGLAPTSPQASSTSRVDINTPASQSYLAYLKMQQGKLIATMTDVLGRTVTPVYSYYYTLDGFVVRLTPAEAARIVTLPGVSSVHLDKARPVLAPDGTLPSKPSSSKIASMMPEACNPTGYGSGGQA